MTRVAGRSRDIVARSFNTIMRYEIAGVSNNREDLRNGEDYCRDQVMFLLN